MKQEPNLFDTIKHGDINLWAAALDMYSINQLQELLKAEAIPESVTIDLSGYFQRRFADYCRDGM